VFLTVNEQIKEERYKEVQVMAERRMLAKTIIESDDFLEIAEQKRKLEEQPDTNQSGSRSDKANKKLLDAIRFFGVGVYEYAKHVTRDQKVPMKCCSWRAFKESFADWKAYRSPDEECFIPFRLECLCYGKGRMPAVFIFGRRMGTEERIRLRFYERREYVGPHPTKSGMFYEGSCFLLGGKPSADGACDLLFAIPLPLNGSDCQNENENVTDKSVNDVLTDAYVRNR